MVKTERVWRFYENHEKSGKNLETWWNSGKEGYHITFEKQNHRICEEICLKPLKYEDLRSVLKKSKEKEKKQNSHAHEVKISFLDTWNFFLIG